MQSLIPREPTAFVMDRDLLRDSIWMIYFIWPPDLELAQGNKRFPWGICQNHSGAI